MAEDNNTSYEDGEYARRLDQSAQQLLGAARLVVKQDFPSHPGETRAFLMANIAMQEELSNMQANVDFFATKMTTKLRIHEASVRSEHKMEGLKTKEERDAACYKNAKWADLNETVENYRVLSTRIVALQWMLKNNYGYVAK